MKIFNLKPITLNSYLLNARHLDENLNNFGYESGFSFKGMMAASYVNSMAALLQMYANSRGIFISPDPGISLNEYSRDVFWRNLATSQSSIKAPNKIRSDRNGLKELKNELGSTKKKGC